MCMLVDNIVFLSLNFQCGYYGCSATSNKTKLSLMIHHLTHPIVDTHAEYKKNKRDIVSIRYISHNITAEVILSSLKKSMLCL